MDGYWSHVQVQARVLVMLHFSIQGVPDFTNFELN
jgi:hypothetical protein